MKKFFLNFEFLVFLHIFKSLNHSIQIFFSLLLERLRIDTPREGQGSLSPLEISGHFDNFLSKLENNEKFVHHDSEIIFFISQWRWYQQTLQIQIVAFFEIQELHSINEALRNDFRKRMTIFVLSLLEVKKVKENTKSFGQTFLKTWRFWELRKGDFLGKIFFINSESKFCKDQKKLIHFLAESLQFKYFFYFFLRIFFWKGFYENFSKFYRTFSELDRSPEKPVDIWDFHHFKQNEIISKDCLSFKNLIQIQNSSLIHHYGLSKSHPPLLHAWRRVLISQRFAKKLEN